MTPQVDNPPTRTHNPNQSPPDGTETAVAFGSQLLAVAAGDLERFDDETLASLNEQFESATADEIIAWAVAEFAPHLTVAASMNDAVLIDLATKADAAVEVAFIDTRYHFPETLDTVERVRHRYSLNLRILTANEYEPPLWQVDPENCCSQEKVAQLDRALEGKRAWMSGLRRAEAETRATAAIISRDRRGIIKINPLANWTDEMVNDYINTHDVPVNPLINQGYPSIGCAPCTRPVAPGEDPRSGRWADSEKTECGLHWD